MSKKKTPGVNLLIIALVGVGAAAAGFGYFSQSKTLRNDTSAAATENAAVPQVDSHGHPHPPQPAVPAVSKRTILAEQPGDIVIGEEDAPLTITEYASLSCPHCAHFHTNVLPALQKEFVDSGKAKIVFRHFPLNEPALRASQLVQCVEDDQRPQFLKVLFSMQQNWAFAPTFRDDLKRIAQVGGVDSAAFDSCMNDKNTETQILQTRQTAQDYVQSTPSIFIDGVRFEQPPEIATLQPAIAEAVKK